MTKGEAPRPLSPQVLDQWEKQGSNNVAGYITTDLEHKLHLLLVGSAMINNVPLTTVLSFFSNQHLSRRPRQDGNTSPTPTETTTMHYCDYLVIFRDRIGLSTSEALHLYHRYAFNQMFNVSAFVDALGSSPTNTTTNTMNKMNTMNDTTTTTSTTSTTSTTTTHPNNTQETLEGESKGATKRERMLQGRLEICRVEIQRLEDKIEQLTHGMTANNTPRLLLPVQDNDARDSDPDQQWREATRIKTTNKASGRRRKKKKTTKTTTKKKYVPPTAAKEQAKDLFTPTVLKDPELERLRQDIVQIILGSKIYNSGKSNQMYLQIMHVLEHSTLTPGASQELVADLVGQLPSIFPLV